MTTLETLLKKYDIAEPKCLSGIGNGWIPILDKLFQRIIFLGWNKDLIQIKEKFGSLRIYIGQDSKNNSNLNKIHEEISLAETLSLSMCEVCGQTAKPCQIRPTHGLVKTVCVSCKKIVAETADAGKHEVLSKFFGGI